jgi:hypothetical protein
VATPVSSAGPDAAAGERPAAGEAGARIEELGGLELHALAWLAVNGGLALDAGVDLGRGSVWAWGVALVVHGAYALGRRHATPSP